MPKSIQFEKLPRKVQYELEEHSLRVKPFVSAQRMWDRLLTTAERNKLGGDLPTCYTKHHGTVGMWMHVRGFRHLRAIIELAHELNFMSDPDHRWLLREIGESTTRNRDANVPFWNREAGELRWKNRIVRRVRILKKTSHVELILNAFEQASWPTRIDIPSSYALDQQQLHQALRSLKNGLRRLTFSSQAGATAITWSAR